MRCLVAVSALTTMVASCTATTAVDEIGDPFKHCEVVTAPANHQMSRPRAKLT